MKKVAKIVVGIFLVIVVLIGGGIAYMFMNTNNSVKALENETIEINDLIWTRYDGIYYICRVLSKWKYCNDDEHRKTNY